MKIPILKCLRCGHAWVPRQEKRKMCPGCKSYYWDVKVAPKRGRVRKK